MTSPNRRRSSGGWPRGLLGMILLVALFESYVADQPARFLNIHHLDWQISGRAANRKASRCEVLCFGDSMLKFGLSPRILQKELGRRTYSFALLDGKPAASYFLFRRVIESGARPVAVTVDFQPECMYEDPEQQLQNPHWASLLSPREMLDLSVNYGSALFFVRTFCSWAIPSLRCRKQVRDNLTVALEGFGPPFVRENERIKRNWRLNQGGLLLAKNPAFDGEVLPEVARNQFLDRWWGRPEHTRYIRRFLALAQERGIRVFWIIPPNTPKVLANQETIGLSARYTRFLRMAMEKHPNLRVIDTRDAGYGSRLFVDPIHLDREGNAAMSHEVAKILRTALSSPGTEARWVELPKYRPFSAPVALEDVDQSLAVVMEREMALRR